MQPINPDEDEMFDSQIQLNVLHNISGLLTKRTVGSNQYKIISSITKEAELKFYQRLRNERFSFDDTEICGTYTFSQPLPSNAKLGKRIKTINGYVVMHPNQKVFIPAFLLNKLSLNLFLPSKRVPIEGHAGAKEEIWLELVYKENSEELFLVMFGLHTSQVYYAQKIQDGIQNHCGLDWDGTNIYTLVETNQASCRINNEPISLWLLRYNLITQTTDYFPVQYYPIDPYGIKLAQNLLLIAEPHGTVALEFVNSQVSEEQNQTTLVYPFEFYIETSFSEPVSLQMPFDKNNKIMSVNTQHVPDNPANITYDSIELTPTSLDKLAYLLSFDRPNLMSPAEVIARQYQFTQHLNPIVAEFLYIYPFKVMESFVPNLYDDVTNATVLSQNDLTFKTSQLRTVYPVYVDSVSFKAHVSQLTNIPVDQLERSQDVQLNQSYPLELKLLDSDKPIQAKIYKLRWFYEDTEISPYIVYNTDEEMPDELKSYLNNQVSSWEELQGSEQITSVYGVTKTKDEWRQIFKPTSGWLVQTTTKNPTVSALYGIQLEGTEIDPNSMIVFVDESANPIKPIATLTMYWILPNKLIVQI